jgi:hypothetical protein
LPEEKPKSSKGRTKLKGFPDSSPFPVAEQKSKKKDTVTPKAPLSAEVLKSERQGVVLESASASRPLLQDIETTTDELAKPPPLPWGLNNKKAIESFKKKNKRLHLMSKKTEQREVLKDPIERLKQFKLKAKKIKEDAAMLLETSNILETSNGNYTTLTLIEERRKADEERKNSDEERRIAGLRDDVVYMWDNVNHHPKEIQRMGTRRLDSQDSFPEIASSLIPKQDKHFSYPRPKGLEPHVTLLVNNYVAGKLLNGEVFILVSAYF